MKNNDPPFLEKKPDDCLLPSVSALVLMLEMKVKSSTSKHVETKLEFLKLLRFENCHKIQFFLSIAFGREASTFSSAQVPMPYFNT